ncbi:MAG: 3-hydroxyacyl-[acyl-carrier-protein] dehydratase FabZ [Pseudomonadota bacterium]|jgi:3-hydroxyacyl-[acyl-carrier-protein] dehydratase
MTAATLPVDLPLQASKLREYLPQRYPMLLVDRVTAVELGHSITGIKNVTINEEFFQGHFPDYPIMPGVLILEAMAQIAGVLGFMTAGKRPSDGYMYLFAGADKVRFKRQVIPGDTLTLYAEMLTSRQGIYKFACRAHVGHELAASVEILVAEQQMVLA